MSNFQRSDLPESINSLEKLAVWALSALTELHGTKSIVETGNRTSYVATCNTFTITATTPPSNRVIGRFTLELPFDYRSRGPVWEQVLDLGDEAIPSGYKE